MRPMPELEVTKIATNELFEYANNAKLHPLEQIDQIASSIEEFGFNSPILAWHNDDGEPEIVAGHGRLMAARKLGIDELPVVFLDHLSDEQRRAYILVDNKLNMNTGFDFAILDNELEGITDIDMSDFGFNLDGVLTEDEMDEFFIEAVPKEDTESSTSTNSEVQHDAPQARTIRCPHCGEIIEL